MSKQNERDAAIDKCVEDLFTNGQDEGITTLWQGDSDTGWSKNAVRSHIAYIYDAGRASAEWVRFGDRLPDEEGEYLVTVAGTVQSAHFCDGKLHLDWGIRVMYAGDPITAWMPWPSPFTDTEEPRNGK